MSWRHWVLCTCLVLGAPGRGQAFVWPNATERIERQLGSENTQERRSAAAQIADLPESVALRLVRVALADSDTEVRLAALGAALELRLSGVSELVIPWLNHPEQRVRMAAIEMLRQSPLDAASAALGRTLSDPDPAIRHAAAEALGASKEPEAALHLLGHLDDTMPRVREAIADALAGLGDPRAVLPLIGKIQDTHAGVRASVARALGELGDARASAALVLALADSDPEVRSAAARALGRLGQDSATLSLVSLVERDPSSEVRRQAMLALGATASQAAISALLGYLGLESNTGDGAQLREASISALTDLGDRALPELLTCVARELSLTRANGCARVLGQLKAKAAVGVLGTALRAGRVERAVGLEALGEIGDPLGLPATLEYLGVPDSHVRLAAIDAAGKLLAAATEEGRAVDPIEAALKGPELGTAERVALARILGLTRSQRAAPTLMAIASDANDVALRRAALEALGHLGPAGQQQVLRDALGDEEPTLRLAAALALREAADAHSARELLELLERAAEQDRRALLLALTGAMAANADRAVTQALADLASASTGGTRDALFEALGNAKTPGLREIFARLLGPGASVADRAKLAEALAQVSGGESLLLALAADMDGAVRANVAWSLGAFAGDAVRQQLGKLTRDRDVAVAGNALGSLGRLARAGQPRSLEALCAAVDDRRSYVRANALAALRVANSRCPGFPERELLRADPSALVRQRAAALLSDVPAPDPELDARALRRCFADEPNGRVATRCRTKLELDASVGEAVTVLVVPSQESEPVARAPFALEMGDGLLRLGLTDRRGAVYEAKPPLGTLSLLVPAPLVP